MHRPKVYFPRKDRISQRVKNKKPLQLDVKGLSKYLLQNNTHKMILYVIYAEILTNIKTRVKNVTFNIKTPVSFGLKYVASAARIRKNEAYRNPEFESDRE